MTITRAAALVICAVGVLGCGRREDPPGRVAPPWSAWIEETAVQRGYIKPGDVAQFGCPRGWAGVEDTAAALRGKDVSTIYRGTDPPPREGTITCVAQQEFAVPAPYPSPEPARDPTRRPLAPLWVEVGADRTTIVFRREVPRSAAVYVGQDTPCGPRLIGVRLGDLLKWLADPHSATTRDFLGLISAGCPPRE